MAQIRSGLIAMIYQKMIGIKIADANESAAVTLMGTDVERIVETWYLLVAELWANLIQLGIAIWLLERQLGAVCVAPIIVALGLLSPTFSFNEAGMLIRHSGYFYLDEGCYFRNESPKGLARSYSRQDQFYFRNSGINGKR
jgi:hypothetical protein